MSVVSRLKQWPAYWTNRRPLTIDSATRFVSITFDDFPKSALDIGGKVLAEHGVAATYYAAFGLAGTDTPSGPVGTTEELAVCLDLGHELGCHTHDHVGCPSLSRQQIEDNLARNRAVAEMLGLPPLQHFAYPFGQFDAAAKTAALKSYISARTTKWGVNRNVADLGLLRSVPLYSHNGRDFIERYLGDVQAKGGWLILYAHDVSDAPSPYGCTPRALDYAISRAHEIGASVLPVGSVIHALQPDAAWHP